MNPSDIKAEFEALRIELDQIKEEISRLRISMVNLQAVVQNHLINHQAEEAGRSNDVQP
jgi:hypothetical protein